MTNCTVHTHDDDTIEEALINQPDLFGAPEFRGLLTSKCDGCAEFLKHLLEHNDGHPSPELIALLRQLPAGGTLSTMLWDHILECGQCELMLERVSMTDSCPDYVLISFVSGSGPNNVTSPAIREHLLNDRCLYCERRLRRLWDRGSSPYRLRDRVESFPASGAFGFALRGHIAQRAKA